MYRYCLLLATALLASACTPTSDIVNSWEPDSRQPTPANHLMIMAVTTDNKARKRYENACEKVFAGAVAKVTVSHDVFSQWKSVNRDSVRREIDARGVDALITTQLAGTQQATASLPEKDMFDRNAIHFYRPAVSYNYRPELDKVPQHPVYLALSNYYQVDREALVWTAMTQTPGGLEPQEVARSQCRALLQGMRQRGYLN